MIGIDTLLSGLLNRFILLVWLGLVLLTIFTPPFGYMRPHKYSDFPRNRDE